MLITFTFTVNTDGNEATYAGNISLMEALNVLQQLAIADAVRKAKEQDKEENKPSPEA